MTGITDHFLRNGGYDKAAEKEIGAARDFRKVYLDFQDFCINKANGRKLCFVAHNANFDLKMINGELRRWRFDEQESAPVLGDVFASSLDTLSLFKEKQWWRTSSLGGRDSLPRPKSFSLSNLHSYVFDESFSNSHNAVGDIRALERLLLCEVFDGWKTTANRVQIPFIKVEKT